MTIDPDRLQTQLQETFGGTDGECRTVARQAVDLADSGRYAQTHDHPLTLEVICAELADAREGTAADRWNWWIGALEVAYGGYLEFRVSQYRSAG